jgi:hypothetical protein
MQNDAASDGEQRAITALMPVIAGDDRRCGVVLAGRLVPAPERRVEQDRVVYMIYATKTLLDRVKQPILTPAADAATALGNWYAMVIFWKPHVALFVNERTLLPVMMPLAPAKDLGARFPAAMFEVLAAHGVNPAFVKTEARLMGSCGWSKKKKRSVVGIMNEFVFLSEHEYRHRPTITLIDLSVRLASTPCGPLYSRHISPDRELRALVDQHR